MAWLRVHLAVGGPHASAEVAAAEEAGITRRALRFAREKMGVMISRQGYRETTQAYWQLPPEGKAEIADTPTDPESLAA